MTIVEQYHLLAGISQSKTEFVNAVKIWWRENYSNSPPASHNLYRWYERHGY